MADEKPEKWRIETNDRYAKIVSTIISLSTGALVLPAAFLREFLGVPNGKALAPFLTVAAYIAGACFVCSVLAGLAYSWVSVKWVKLAWGQKTLFSEHCLERAMDLFFVFMLLLFLGGIFASVWFFVFVKVAPAT